jgi:fructokinase
MTGRALVVGESLVDVVHRLDGTIDEHPGGSPANVALGLGRLGRKVDLLTWLGRDAYGAMVSEHLAESGVHLVPGSDGAGQTSVATATLDPTGAARYDFQLEWRLPETAALEPAPLVVHTGSIAAVLPPGAADVAALLAAARPDSTITYDPNARPSLMGDPGHAGAIIEPLVELSDVVKVSDEDLEWLYAGRKPIEVAREWAQWGPAVVVMTRGGHGAVAITSRGIEVEMLAPKVAVADTVGAGDSFMGGLIDGLWTAGLLGADRRGALHAVEAGTVAEVLAECVRIAAITVSRPGANPPSRAELDALDAAHD